MRYGIIGCGVMGSTVAAALIKGAGKDQVLVTNRSPQKAESFAKAYGCGIGSNEQAAACDYLVMAVKPQMMETVLRPLQPILAQREKKPVLVSMAAGLTLSTLLSMAGISLPVIRIMPNVPASVGLGVITYCAEGIDGAALDVFLRDMASAGTMDELPESLMDAASAIAGCGPAWCFQMIEAMADAGVACGLPRKKAQLYAARMMQGSAALCAESGKHPGEWKDAVCSPGGSTIQGVRVLEERGFRGTVMDAVMAAYQKSAELGKGK